MTKQRHNEENERLDEYLDGNSPVSDAYRKLEQPEPPAALDRVILKAAQDEVSASRKRSGSMVFWQRWMTPLSAVAAMGLCLAVILQFMDDSALSPNVLQRNMELSSPQSYSRDTDRLSQLMVEKSEPAGVNQQEILAADNEPASAPDKLAAAPVYKESLQEVVVVGRKRRESLAEVPMAITATSDADQNYMVADVRRHETDLEASPAADARLAWEQGARPAADVWLAGIDAFYAMDDMEKTVLADAELNKMNLIYPTAVARAKEEKQDAEITASLALRAPAKDQAAKTAAGDLQTTLPHAEIWAAGIEWLENQGEDERADAELEKFRHIYPNFEF